MGRHGGTRGPHEIGEALPGFVFNPLDTLLWRKPPFIEHIEHMGDRNNVTHVEGGATRSRKREGLGERCFRWSSEIDWDKNRRPET
jgi:hypothetical protein